MKRLPRSALLAAALVVSAGAGVPSPALTDTFPDASAIETSLDRGISTKRDVQALLGVPDGVGGAIFPPDHREHQVWFYETIEILGMVAEGDVTKIGASQKILIVFFHQGLFDGFAWSMSRVPGEVR